MKSLDRILNYIRNSESSRIKNDIAFKLTLVREVLMTEGIETLPFSADADDVPYRSEFEDYIRKKARDVLPASQFTGRVETGNTSDIVEISGLIGYEDGIIELGYCSPRKGSLENKKYFSDDVLVKWNRHLEAVPADKIADMDALVIWHTHPTSEGYDFDDIKAMLKFSDSVKDIYDKPVFSALYIPRLDNVYWAEIRKEKDAILQSFP